MFKHKIFSLLSTFSKKDVLKFRDFLKSPYFNKSKNLVELYNLIIKYYPSFNKKELTKELLYTSVFKREKYRDSTVRNHLAKLLHLAEKFITIEGFCEDTFGKDNRLLSQLLAKRQNDLFMMNLKKTELRVKDNMEVDFDYLMNMYEIERNKFNMGILTDKIVTKKKIYTHIRKLSDSAIYLTIYYLTEIICQYLNVVVYHEKFNVKQLSNFISTVLSSYDMEKVYNFIKNENDCDFVLEIYIALFKTLSNLEKDSAYYSYKNLITVHSKKLSRDELWFHYSALISCCILKGKLKGYNEQYSDELLSLYSVILSNKYYTNKRSSYLPTSLYRDILLLEIRLKRWEQAELLINNYCKDISPLEKNNMLNFSNAFYHYEKKDFEKALAFCNKIKLDYFIYKYDIKNLMLKVYYELDYYEEALSMIHSYREFLRKDEFLTDNRKLRHKNFVKYLEKLILAKSSGKVKYLEQIKFNLLKENEISFKKWILGKIDELKCRL